MNDNCNRNEFIERNSQLGDHQWLPVSGGETFNAFGGTGIDDVDRTEKELRGVPKTETINPDSKATPEDNKQTIEVYDLSDECIFESMYMQNKEFRSISRRDSLGIEEYGLDLTDKEELNTLSLINDHPVANRCYHEPGLLRSSLHSQKDAFDQSSYYGTEYMSQRGREGGYDDRRIQSRSGATASSYKLAKANDIRSRMRNLPFDTSSPSYSSKFMSDYENDLKQLIECMNKSDATRDKVKEVKAKMNWEVISNQFKENGKSSDSHSPFHPERGGGFRNRLGSDYPMTTFFSSSDLDRPSFAVTPLVRAPSTPMKRMQPRRSSLDLQGYMSQYFPDF